MLAKGGCCNKLRVETEIFLPKVLYIKVKVSWNSIMRLINYAKKYNETHK